MNPLTESRLNTNRRYFFGRSASAVNRGGCHGLLNDHEKSKLEDCQRDEKQNRECKNQLQRPAATP